MNVKLGYTIQFPAGIWWDDQIIMNHYILTIKMITVTKNRHNHQVCLERLKYIVQAVLTDAVFIDESEEEQIGLLDAAHVRMIVLPDIPIDQIIGMMLYSKLNAVFEGNMLVRSVLLSSDASDNVIVEHNDDEMLSDPFNTEGWWTDPGPACEDVIELTLEDDAESVFVISAADPWAEISDQLVWDKEVDESKNTVVLPFRKDEAK